MNPPAHTLISGYLDEMLTSEEEVILARWIEECPENAQRFAEEAFLHDRLRSEIPSLAALTQVMGAVDPVSAKSKSRPLSRSRIALITGTLAALIAITSMWRGMIGTPVAAATTEWNRVVAISGLQTDRTYRIKRESATRLFPDAGGPIRVSGDAAPPLGSPGPILNGALLHVRGGSQFVLVRKGPDGGTYVSGFNGDHSWDVRPGSPVRVSTNETGFRHGVPGQGDLIPLISIHDGLESLGSAYNIELRPEDGSEGKSFIRVLTAERKSPDHNGPRRVEITYSVRSGLIRQLRLVDLPRENGIQITVLLTLIEERDLGADFFNHESHHEPGLHVQVEE